MFVSNGSLLVDRMLDWTRQVDEAMNTAAARAEGRVRTQLWLPAIDVFETDEAFVIAADLPGVHKENVDVQFDRGSLTISGTRAATLPSSEKAPLRVFNGERVSGEFSRSVRLPSHVDAERISAAFVDGVLTLTVPKSKAALPRKITVG